MKSVGFQNYLGIRFDLKYLRFCKNIENFLADRADVKNPPPNSVLIITTVGALAWVPGTHKFEDLSMWHPQIFECLLVPWVSGTHNLKFLTHSLTHEVPKRFYQSGSESISEGQAGETFFDRG